MATQTCSNSVVVTCWNEHYSLFRFVDKILKEEKNYDKVLSVYRETLNDVMQYEPYDSTSIEVLERLNERFHAKLHGIVRTELATDNCLKYLFKTIVYGHRYEDKRCEIGEIYVKLDTHFRLVKIGKNLQGLPPKVVDGQKSKALSQELLLRNRQTTNIIIDLVDNYLNKFSKGVSNTEQQIEAQVEQVIQNFSHCPEIKLLAKITLFYKKCTQNKEAPANASTIKDVNKENRVLQLKMHNLLQPLLEDLARADQRNPFSQLTNFYFSVLDSFRCPPLVLDVYAGGKAEIAACFLISNLERYIRESKNSLDTVAKQLLSQAVTELQVLEKLCIKKAACFLVKDESNLQIKIKELAVSLHDQIKSQLKAQKFDIRVIIPGDFFHENYSHFAVYEIGIEDIQKGLFSFTVIDSDGPHLSGGPLDRKQTQDQIYTHLTLSNLSPEFFTLLMRDDLPDFLTKSLGKVGPDGTLSNQTTGRVHKTQKSGHSSCTVKGLLAWLHHRLGRKLYFQFKEKMTQYEIEKFDSYSHLLELEHSQETINEIRQEAEKIRQKRALKAK